MKKHQKWFAVLLTVIIAATIWGVSPGSSSNAASLDTVPVGYVGIYTASDLNNIRNNLSGNYILMNDIDLTPYATGNGWMPIAYMYEPFSGTLDGNGYTLSNLVLNQPGGESPDYYCTIGLFAYVDGGTIKNLNVLATANYSDDSYSSISFGTIAGMAKRITIDNCQAQIAGSIQGSELQNQVDVGGLIGRNDASFIVGADETDDPNQYATITNCHVTGELTGSAEQMNLGGLVGYGRDVLIQSSTNEANIFCSALGNYMNYHLAGIVGYGMAFELAAVSNKGTVSSNKIVDPESNTYISIAGIIVAGEGIKEKSTGTYFPKNITDTVNSGLIQSTTYDSYAAGIIVPWGYGEVRLLNCANSGNIDVTNDYWGIASGITTASVGSVVQCYNTGDVHSLGLASGIAYKNVIGEIQECYNTGTIEGALGAAGVLYQNLDLVEDCYNAGYIRGPEASGIALYNASYALINSSYNVGGVESTEQTPAGITGENVAVVGDTFYYENTSVGVAINNTEGVDESEKIYTDQLDDQETYAGFDFGEPIIEESFTSKYGYGNMAPSATTGVWRMSANTGMPTLNGTQEVYVSGISVAAKPTKYYHLINETVHTSGLILKITMSDGTSSYINKGFVLKPYSKSSGTRNITVTYNGKTTTFPINFSNITVPSTGYTTTRVSWTGTTGATSYKIYRATSASGSYQLIYTASSSARSYVNSGLSTGKTYYYKVRPMFRTTSGTASTARAGKVLPVTPSLKVDSGTWLSWNAVGGSNYEIWRSTSLTGTYKLIKTLSATEYMVPEVSGGNTYFYKIRAYHTENGVKIYSNWSNPVWIIK